MFAMIGLLHIDHEPTDTTSPDVVLCLAYDLLAWTPEQTAQPAHESCICPAMFSEILCLYVDNARQRQA